ncbi:MAG: transcription-repair coupling factor [Odoribacteraceae bacterium]|nr:transcription-repair coupling factor [Odoribacteraceae bacterium]
MNVGGLIALFQKHPAAKRVIERLKGDEHAKVRMEGDVGSSLAFLAAVVMKEVEEVQFFVLDDREEAAYLYNDLVALTGEEHVRFLPASYRRAGNFEDKDNDSILARAEVLNALADHRASRVVTYTEALVERVVTAEALSNLSMPVSRGDALTISFLESLLAEYNFERAEFVYSPGQFSIRGGIVDVYSFAEEHPARLEFNGDKVESIRYFNVETQLSEQQVQRIMILPDLSDVTDRALYGGLSGFAGQRAVWWVKNALSIHDRLNTLKRNDSNDVWITPRHLFDDWEGSRVLEWGSESFFRGEIVRVEAEPQPAVNKQFDLLASHLIAKQEEGYALYICSSNEMQLQRLRDIFSDKGLRVNFSPVDGTVHDGFSDTRLKICVYTEHQIFDRYHKYTLKTTQLRKERESITISELQNLHPGDYVVHVDHGIGRFGGLVRLDNNGKEQEAIRLVYQGSGELYVGLHSLHKVSKYRGKEGIPPAINKLGGDAWSRLKQRAKSRVKEIARELIALYARRRQETAFAFSKDNYLQEEMEASFIYEETPDQMKAIKAVKSDMEDTRVMDRLICGDVGFGKTEVAIRAAFKAVADSKQVAVLVPTTVLAYQHYHTFTKRLAGMPCRVEYISRMRKPAENKRAIEGLADGKVDIIIGTHRLTSKEIRFKDLGLLVVDEEQKFGVDAKERLKRLKLNVDTITMTATPIPRTLQFSLMGARDMSIIRTPPSNRYPIVTELHRFDEGVIRDALLYEMSRGGQVFFIHNRVETICEVQFLLHRLVPGIKSCVGHGQMHGDQLERVMHDFIRGDYDVLIATTIVESGLDIPNANTIIIDQAQNYGLSDLHQLRGRVGRSSRKAFCYLLAPPLEMINMDARRRLKAIEDFSGLGSGFNIAMQDLDIRGAGNILGGEQSGFVTEIGYETYLRILNEALLELREEEGPLADAGKERPGTPVTFAVDCVVDTDLEMLIPEGYVESVSERVRLYRELDNLADEASLLRFEVGLRDRFGEIPLPVKGLLEVVRTRNRCQEIGVERLVLKNEKMVLYFISDQRSPFYASPLFNALLKFVQRQSIPCNMGERNGRLTLTFAGVSTMERAATTIRQMHERVIGNEYPANA